MTLLFITLTLSDNSDNCGNANGGGVDDDVIRSFMLSIVYANCKTSGCSTNQLHICNWLSIPSNCGGMRVP